IRRMIPADGIQVIATASSMTLNLPRQHWKRVIKVIERLRLRIDQYLAGRIYAAPLFEKAGRKFCRDSEAGYRIAAPASESVFDALAGARLGRHEYEVGKLAEPRAAGSRWRACLFRLVVVLFLGVFTVLRERFDHQAVAGHEPLVIRERHADVRGLVSEHVIRKSQLDGYVLQRNSRDQIRRDQKGEHRRQHQI